MTRLLSVRLNIPMAHISREAITQQLSLLGMNAEKISRWLDFLDTLYEQAFSDEMVLRSDSDIFELMRVWIDELETII